MKKIFAVFTILLLIAGCPARRNKTVEKERPTIQEIELSSADFEELDGWQEDDLATFIQVFADNCRRIGEIKTPFLDNSRIKIKTAAYQRICSDFSAQKQWEESTFRSFIEQNFTPFLIQADGTAEGKFTSYYESEIRASRQRHGKYRWPVYGKPNDLIEINLRDFSPDLPDTRLVGRINGQKMIPYYTRAEIEKNSIQAPVLLWGDSPVDIHIMQIQGSAVARLDDGSNIRIGYADNNGRQFRGIGSILLQKKLLEPNQRNMISIKKWLENNPDRAIELMQENERYIFHRIIKADGPIGAFGIPLTAGRSLAVDRQYVPLGSLLWLNTVSPRLNKLVAAQDIGGAIKGAVRGDYFWGSGGDDVLALSGSMNTSGHYYILIPNGTIDNQ